MEKKTKVGIAAAMAVLAGAGIGIGALTAGGGGGSAMPAGTATASPAGAVNPLTGEPGTAGRLLAVKIDNVSAARPAVGLGQADVVYVERVEGGLSRFMAVYDDSHLPSQAGPVRSARETDLRILSQYGKPALAYSGAVGKFLPTLHAADIVNVSPAERGGAYVRDEARVPPHDLFVRTAGLTEGASVAKDIGLRFGAVPQGGHPAVVTNTSMPAASFRFTWNGASMSYGVLMDGRDTAAGARPQNVIIQHVKVTDSPGGIVDTNGGGTVSEPFSETVGSGAATVLRDGQSFAVTWHRPTPDAGTTYTYHGTTFPLHAGQTWIVLN